MDTHLTTSSLARGQQFRNKKAAISVNECQSQRVILLLGYVQDPRDFQGSLLLTVRAPTVRSNFETVFCKSAFSSSAAFSASFQTDSSRSSSSTRALRSWFSVNVVRRRVYCSSCNCSLGRIGEIMLGSHQ